MNASTIRRRPVVVQHSFGDVGSGGPINALTRIMRSPLAERYDFLPMHQTRATGNLDWARIVEWRDFLRSAEPDIVHVRGLGGEGFHGVLAARLAGCPRVLVSIHGSIRDLVQKRVKDVILSRVAEPATLRLATHVATVCEFTAGRAFVQSHRNKLVGPMINGVDVVPSVEHLRSRAREQLGIEDDAFVGIIVSRLTQEKGHSDLADALVKVRRLLPMGTVILVVGDGPGRVQIGDNYRQTGVDVRMLGKRTDVTSCLAASDVFLFPTLHENLSNALLEAMAVGLPVIATAVGGNAEVLRKGGGVLVPRGDSAAFAEALVRLSGDPRARESLGRGGREVIRMHYSLENMCRSYDRVYREVLDQRA